eukprot:m.260571 g.260571  ORF g.260571 m.260571 type:complete len:609 (-) comp40134_c0_seq1:29-1855(-)
MAQPYNAYGQPSAPPMYNQQPPPQQTPNYYQQPPAFVPQYQAQAPQHAPQQFGAPPPQQNYRAPATNQPPARHGASDFVVKVKLRISCKDVISLDLMSKSDPFCIVSVGGPGKWREFDRTEAITNSSHPNFLKTFDLDYRFEEKQHIRFDVYDHDGNSASTGKHDYIGGIETTLGTIVGAASGQFTMPLKFDTTLISERKVSMSSKKKNNARGVILVAAEELNSGSKGFVTLEFRGQHLDKKDFFGKSDPYFEIWRKNENHDVLVHRSETIKKTLNPSWKKLRIDCATLWGDGSKPVEIKVYDWDSDGSHDFIGSCTIDFQNDRTKEWDLINPKKVPGGKKAKKGYKNSGVLQMVQFHVEEIKSFLSYLKEGLELNFAVAVDFTGSNGDPSQPASLHYSNPYAPNQYQVVIESVGNIIQDYDSDGHFPAFGYGAKINGVANHCFSLNGNPNDANVQGVRGILDAYSHAIQAYPLWGPTNFSPVINTVAAMARQDPKHYFVLLIATDGIITDQPQTISAIVAASRINMSIIIVGVGSADFAQMEELDADDKALVDPISRTKAVRDIVQFVPFRKFGNAGPNNADLAREVLAELPKQVEEHMRLRTSSTA